MSRPAFWRVSGISQYNIRGDLYDEEATGTVGAVQKSQ